MDDPFQYEAALSKYSRADLESALAGAHIIAEQAGAIIRERDARIAELEAAARDLINLIGHGRASVQNGRMVRECILPEETVTRLRRAVVR